MSGGTITRQARGRCAVRAAAHVEIRMVDPDGNQLPRGQIGEVIVRGDNVMAVLVVH